MKDKIADNILDADCRHLGTSIAQARSHIDGREYPVEPLSVDQAQELADALGIELDPRSMWALADAVRASARNLAAFFDARDPAAAAKYNGQRRDELERLATDPARTILSPADNLGAQAAHDLLRALADEHGCDPMTTAGAVVIGDLAAAVLCEKPQRADYHFTQGEAQLFDDIISIITAIAPERVDSLPSNTNRDQECPASNFAVEFTIKVVDQVRASFPGNEQVQNRLDKLKNKSPGAILDGLRSARQWYRENPPVMIATTTDPF